MNYDPTIKIEEIDETIDVVMSPTEDEWDNIHGDLVLF
jgi:hypothetical protein